MRAFAAPTPYQEHLTKFQRGLQLASSVSSRRLVEINMTIVEDERRRLTAIARALSALSSVNSAITSLFPDDLEVKVQKTLIPNASLGCLLQTARYGAKQSACVDSFSNASDPGAARINYQHLLGFSGVG